MERQTKMPSPILVAAAALLLPGLGYYLVGERKRAVVVGSALLLMFLGGILIAGIRVFEVPGYGEDGRKVYIQVERTNSGYVLRQTSDPGPDARWSLAANFRGEVGNHIWFLPQVLMGLPALAGGHLSNLAAMAGVAKSHARLAEIGTLYTAVAGMLNLLAVIDAVSRCPAKEEE